MSSIVMYKSISLMRSSRGKKGLKRTIDSNESCLAITSLDYGPHVGDQQAKLALTVTRDVVHSIMHRFACCYSTGG